MNVPVSFHYTKRYLRKTFKCFISLKIQLMNLLSFSFHNHMYVHVYFMCIYMYICAFYVWNLFVCVYVAVYLCCSFWVDFLQEDVSFKEAALQRCSVKKVFLEISQNSQGNVELAGLDLQLYSKRDSGTGIFLWILQNSTPLVAAPGFRIFSQLFSLVALIRPAV